MTTMPDSARSAVAAYYRVPAVRARLLEYCGGMAAEPATAVFVTGFDPARQPYPTWDTAARVPYSALEELAERGCDVSRSLWDTRALFFVLDLDYQNLDYPGEPFTHASNVFFKLENTYAGIKRVLGRFGLRALAIA